MLMYSQFCRECPYDLKEAIASIIFAAPRCADLPELQQVSPCKTVISDRLVQSTMYNPFVAHM